MQDGKAGIFDKSSCTEMMQAVRASSSIPMLSRMVKVNRTKIIWTEAFLCQLLMRELLNSGMEKWW